MPKINLWAVLVAAVVAFVVGALWYSPLLFARAYTKVRGMTPPGAMAAMRPPVWEMLGEFVKNIVVAYVLAYFVVCLGVGDCEECIAAGTLGLGWVSSHAADGRCPS